MFVVGIAAAVVVVFVVVVVFLVGVVGVVDVVVGVGILVFLPPTIVNSKVTSPHVAPGYHPRDSQIICHRSLNC